MRGRRSRRDIGLAEGRQWAVCRKRSIFFYLRFREQMLALSCIII
jgi:hypothetical protein